MTGANALGALALIVAAEALLRRHGERPDNRAPVFRPCFFTDDEGIFRATRSCPDLGPVNAEGFPGAEFSPSLSKRSMLILGDSFAWGAAARPQAPSFADYLAQAGWTVFNTGIPGTSTNQYVRLASKWIERLTPGLVAVFFFIGNDFDRPPLHARQNLWHVTDDGQWLYGFDAAGASLSAAEAFRRWQGLGLPGVRHHASDLLRRTVVGSRLHRALRGLTPGTEAAPGGSTECRAQAPAATLADLRTIQAAAAAHRARFELFVIPARASAGRRFLDVPCASLLQALHPHWPPDLIAGDYTNGPTPHLTADGHRRFARFVEAELAAGGRAEP